jgi:hypothetical protein
LRVLASYRLHWQVELAFKRMKSLVGLEELRGKDASLARAWINTALLAALLTDADADLFFAATEPGGENEDEETVPSTKGPAFSP